jgi:molecular chaperone GrpE (heat shock protein)
MSDNEKAQKYDPDSFADAGDVEILEVVGVDDDVPAPSAAESEDDSDEVVLQLDADTDASDDDETGFAERPGEGSSSTPASADDSEPAGGESELLRRLRADYDNLRKRVARERDDFQLQANSGLIEGLLPVLDNFERALRVEFTAGIDEAFRDGMVMIYGQFNEALREQGLRRIEALGKPFDPNLHDAVATDADADAPANTVVEEYQRGYLFQNRVLRPALVKVSTNARRGGPPDPELGDR